MTPARAWRWLLIGATLAAGCSAATEPTPTLVPTESPASGQAGGLPAGCQPIDLRTPSGEAIELDGTWVHDAGGNTPMTWWVRTLGDCVWATGTVADVPEDPGDLSTSMATVQIFQGRLRTDFVIEGEIVLVGPPGFRSTISAGSIHAPVRLLVEFDENGGVSLREDRVYGEQGPRCVNPSGSCLQPLVLVPRSGSGD